LGEPATDTATATERGRRTLSGRAAALQRRQGSTGKTVEAKKCWSCSSGESGLGLEGSETDIQSSGLNAAQPNGVCLAWWNAPCAPGMQWMGSLRGTQAKLFLPFREATLQD